jgi:hypothetical protein
MRNLIASSMVIILLIVASNASAEQKQSLPDFAWANGIIYSAQITPIYQPGEGTRNTLYVFDGLKGQRPVAEAGPGDDNYHDGRWQVVILEFTPLGKNAFDINNDGYSEFEITSWQMAQHYLNEHGFLKMVGQGSIFDAPLVRPKGLEPPDKK